MLKSNRICLSELGNLDISDEYLNTLNDKEYMRFSRNTKKTHSELSQLNYISEFNSSRSILLGIRKISDKELIGTVNCFINFDKMQLDIGLLIFKAFAQHKYGQEALLIFCTYLEREFPGMTIVIGTSKENIAMQKVAKNLNFEILANSDIKSNDYIKFMRNNPEFDSNVSAFIPKVIMNAKKIGVACNDAGGAEQIVWLLRNLRQKPYALIDGPASMIFLNSQISFKQVESLDELRDCDLIITGSGWMTDLERKVVKFANQMKITNLTILDHWVNYLERFRFSKEYYPQILAVTNSQALSIAKETFASKLIYLLPDFQIEHYKKVLQKAKHSSNNILIISEPTNLENPLSSINRIDLETLYRFANLIKNDKGFGDIILRLHPSLIRDESFKQFSLQILPEIKFSSGTDLIADLVNSKIVIGLSSYALYIAAKCGIDTYSLFSGLPNHWSNLHPEIRNLSDYV
jgi:RimJ/RimL family protein N-acetyltransferase